MFHCAVWTGSYFIALSFVLYECNTCHKHCMKQQKRFISLRMDEFYPLERARINGSPHHPINSTPSGGNTTQNTLPHNTSTVAMSYVKSHTFSVDSCPAKDKGKRNTAKWHWFFRKNRSFLEIKACKFSWCLNQAKLKGTISGAKAPGFHKWNFSTNVRYFFYQFLQCTRHKHTSLWHQGGMCLFFFPFPSWFLFLKQT